MSRARRVTAFAVAETVGRAATWLTVFLLPWFLEPDEYGIVVLLATFEGMATGLLMLGQDRAVMWRGSAQDALGGAKPWVATAVIITVGAGLVGLCVVALASVFATERVLGVPVWPHLWLLAVAVIFVNLNRVVLAFVRVAGRARDFAAFRTATGAGRLAVTLGLAGLGGSSVAFPAGATLGTIGGGAILWRRILGDALAEGSDWRPDVASLARYGAPLSLHAIAGNSIAFVDRWIIGSMLGLAVVGSYGWFYMLGSSVAFVYAALNVYYEPAIYRECQQGGPGRTLHEYLGICMIAAGGYSLLGAGVATVGQGLVPEGVQGDAAITRVVLVAYWIYPIYLAGNYLLSAFGRTGRVAVISSAALVVVLVANLVLIPEIGAIGGAWATLAGTLSLVAMAMAMAHRAGSQVRNFVAPIVAISALGACGVLLPGTSGLAVASAGLIIYGVLHARGRDQVAPA